MSETKRTYVITVRTSFEDTLHIEASSVEEAKELAIEEFVDSSIQNLEPNTEVVYVGLQGGK